MSPSKKKVTKKSQAPVKGKPRKASSGRTGALGAKLKEALKKSPTRKTGSSATTRVHGSTTSRRVSSVSKRHGEKQSRAGIKANTNQTNDPVSMLEPKVKFKEKPSGRARRIADELKGQRVPTQFPGEGKDEVREIVVGLDFGTSSTKVVFRDSAINVAYGVSFDALAYEDHPYILASRVMLGGDWTLSLSGSGTPINHLKLLLIQWPDREIVKGAGNGRSATVGQLVAGYLALVLRMARHWFLKEKEAVYRGITIDWQLNIGIPSQNYADKDINQTYRQVALAAWRASLRSAPLSLNDIQADLEQVRNEAIGRVRRWQDTPDALTEKDIAIVPEVIAEVLGYERSPHRRDGLHLLIDVGAGTFDAATFTVLPHGENRFCLLSTAVRSLGALNLCRHRRDRVVEATRDRLDRIIRDTRAVDPIPGLDVFAGGLDNSAAGAVDAPFTDQCAGLVWNVVVCEKTGLKGAHGAPMFREMVAFVCGGGRALDPYQTSVKRLAESLSKHKAGWRRLEILELPKPRELEAKGLPASEYHRISVAYGLSFPAADVGRVRPETEIPDPDPPAVKQWHDELFVSKEQV